MAGLGQGHESANQSYQTDGLRDTDVLTSSTLTNFNERGLMNGVIPVSVNNYHSSNSNRLSSTAGNCAVSSTGNPVQSVVIAAGTVLLDGMFYEVSSTTLDISSNSNTGKFPYNSSALPTLTSTNHERIMLVYLDPTLAGFIGLTYGSEIDTSGGSYPQSPTGHLAKHTIVLASCRLTKTGSNVIVSSVDDKRVFIRPGPMPLSSLSNHSSNGSNPANDFIAGSQAGTLPVTDLGFLFARDPAGLSGSPNGTGQTHLFFQSDQGLGETAGGGGAYQITPVHRTSKKIFTWDPSSSKTITFGTDILFKPLQSQDQSDIYLIEIFSFDVSDTGSLKHGDGVLIQGPQGGGGTPVGEFYVNTNGTAITIPAHAGYNTGGADRILLTYTHAGHA
tara:strand:- start:20063 stop:21232 length:1170 start_codon:yes stop_codon:yes gene_type:complete